MPSLRRPRPAFAAAPLLFATRAPTLQKCTFLPRATPFPRVVYVAVGARRALTTPSAVTAVAPLQEGFIVEYAGSGGAARLGVCLRPDGKKNWMVGDETGGATSVTPKGVLYVVGGVGEDVGVFRERIGALVEENEELLEVAWEIVAGRGEDEGGNVAGVEDVAELVLGGAGVEERYAAHVMLGRDGVFFRKRVVKGVAQYEAKAAELVEEARKAALIGEEREREEGELREAIVQSFNGGRAGGDTSVLRGIIGEEAYGVTVAALEAVAEDFGGKVREEGYESNSISGYAGLDTQHKEAAKMVLKAVRRPLVPSNAFDVLVAWGVFARHENLALRRAGMNEKMTFPESVLRAAKELNERPAETVEDLDAAVRKDLTGLVCYAVDSADTEEVDDAISWDAESEMLWVHIADPTRFFPGGMDETLVVEALRRTTTMYLPTKRYTMFPDVLACDRLSLDGKNADGSALSFGFKLCADGSVDKDSIVVTPSKVRPPVRLTYEAVDELLEREAEDSTHDICVMTRLAERRIAFREEDGAVIASSPFSKVSVKEADSEEPIIVVGLESTANRSWTLVSELMITACGIAGDFGEKHELPLAYRGQEGFEYPSEEALLKIPEGPARIAAIFKSASPSEVRSEPIDHASLGLDAYVQVTSPIRRSVDMIAHMQIKAVVRGDTPPLDLDGMNAEIARNNDFGRTMRQIESGTTKYWHLEYLRRLGPKKSHEAIYVRPLRDSTKLGLVYFVESGFQLVANIPSGTEPGARVAVVVKQNDPRSLSSMAEATLWASHESQQKEEAEFLDDLFSAIDSDSDSEGEEKVPLEAV